MPTLTFRRLTSLVLGCLLVASAGVVGRHPAAAAAIGDSWSSIGTFRTPDGWYASPVHASVLTDGRVLFVGVARPVPTQTSPSRRVAWVLAPPAPGQPIPEATMITEVTEPVEFEGQAWGTT